MHHLSVTLLVEFADADTAQKVHYRPDTNNQSNYQRITILSHVCSFTTARDTVSNCCQLLLTDIKCLEPTNPLLIPRYVLLRGFA